MVQWDLIIDGPQDGTANMAVDAALLDEVENSEAPKTIVRFYQWIRPTISLGRNQKLESAVDQNYCSQHSIDVVHRPTGGRAVLHDDELTYAVASSDSTCFGDNIYANYKRVSEALCEGYRRLGVAATLAPETRKTPTAKNGADLPCFISPSRYELTVGGRKVVGSAQRRVRRSFLQHGSMPISCDREALARATLMTETDSLYREMAGIAEFLSQRPSVSELTDIFVGSFEATFGIEFRQRTFALLV